MRLAALASLIALSVSLASPARAQSMFSPWAPPLPERVSVDDVVREPMFIASASIEPHISSQLTVGNRTSAVQPFVYLPGNLDDYVLTVSPEMAIGVPWVPNLLFYGAAGGSAIVGANNPSLVARSTDVSGGATLGLVWSPLSRLVDDASRCQCGWRVSLNGRVTRTYGMSVLVERLIPGIQDNPQYTDTSAEVPELAAVAGGLAVSYTEWRPRVDLAGTYAWAQHFWLQGSVGVEGDWRSYSPPAGLADAIKSSRIAAAPRIGFAAGYDTACRCLPVALSLEYQATINQETVLNSSTTGSPPTEPRLTDAILAVALHTSRVVFPRLQLGLAIYDHFGIVDPSVATSLVTPRAQEIGASAIVRYAW